MKRPQKASKYPNISAYFVAKQQRSLWIYSSQLDFRLGVEKRAPDVYTGVQEDASNEDNNAENSSAKSIQGLREKMIQTHSKLCGGHFLPKTQ
jgi:hypothetical protein